MRFVKKAKYIEDYKILLIFDDKTKKIVDFKTELNDFEGEIFQPLKDLSYFKKFKLDSWTVNWPNGADVCPDTLYEIGEDVQEPPKKTIKTRQRKRVAISAHALTKKRKK